MQSWFSLNDLVDCVIWACVIYFIMNSVGGKLIYTWCNNHKLDKPLLKAKLISKKNQYSHFSSFKDEFKINVVGTVVLEQTLCNDNDFIKATV